MCFGVLKWAYQKRKGKRSRKAILKKALRSSLMDSIQSLSDASLKK